MKNVKLGGMIAALMLSTLSFAAPALDTSFNGSGKRNIYFDLPSEKWDEATDTVVQPDGKIIVVGFARKAPISGTGDVGDLTAARINSDGSTDFSFASAGKLSMNLASGGRFNDRANAVALDALGRIYIAGNTEGNFGQGAGFVMRLSANGSLDTSYGYNGVFIFTDGSQTPSPALRFEDIAIDSSSRAVVVGNQEKSNGSLNDGLVLRLTTNGQLDSSFTGAPDPGNSVGFRMLSLIYGAAYNDEIKRVAIAPDGSIFAAGSFQGTSNDFDFVVYKLNASNGALVQSFGSAGRTRNYLDQGDKYDRMVDFKLLPNGALRLLGNCRVVLATGAVLRGCLLGLTASGAVDSAFNSFQTATAFRTFPVNNECNGVGGEARSLVVQTALNSAVIVLGEQKPNSCSSVSQMAMSQHSNSAQLVAYNLPYSTSGSWANAAAFDAQSRLLVICATVLSARDVDKAVARIVGF